MPSSRTSLLSCAALVASGLTLVVPPALAVSPDVVVAEVYGGGGNAGATLRNDFIELRNTGSSAVDVSSWSVQYAAAAGTTWQVTNLVGSIPAGGRYLVQQAAGTGGTADLPTPDATGSTAMSATAGKVALVAARTACTGTTCVGADLRDLVGYGSAANGFEGTGPAPAPSNTSSTARTAGDTDQNAADFAVGPPTPQGAGASPDPGPTPSATPTATATPAPSGTPAPVVRIPVIQGGGATSPRVGQVVTVEAVVTGFKSANDAVSSYFLQEQDAEADGDPATSEGLQVVCGAQCPTALAAGAVVTVTGTVEERFGMTRLVTSAATGTVVTGTAARPTPAAIQLPAAASTRDAATFEAVEAMLTTVPQALAVTEFFNLARFGELLLTAGDRPYQFTHTSAPSAAGNTAHLAELATRRLILDDGSEDQNDATSGPDANEPYPFPTGGLSLTNRFRGGDTITNLTGVLEYGFGAWRMQPAPDVAYQFVSVNPRPPAPAAVGGRLRVASYNVLNYFATIDTTASGDTGPCGPAGTADCRGADSASELERQRTKTISALAALDADVLGLIEVQNDDGAATEQLLTALNAATAPGTYDYVRTGTIGTDAIKLALLYKPAKVSPAGAFTTLTTAKDPEFIDTRNRPALVQTFIETGTGSKVTVALNHLKSKGSSCGAGDDSVADGSGNCDGTRTRAAEALVRFLATDPTGSGDPDVLLIGDLNSYKRERPITTLTSAGYTDLVERFGGEGAYGYLFDGQLGYLDHALASASLNPQVTGATEWHLNADEPVLFDYNDEVLDAGEAAFERESSARPLYAPDAYRSSDHDAVLVGLDLAGVAPSPSPSATSSPSPSPSSSPSPSPSLSPSPSPSPSSSPSSSPSDGPTVSPSASPSPSPSSSPSSSPSAGPTVSPSASPSSSPSSSPSGAPTVCRPKARLEVDRPTVTAPGTVQVAVRAAVAATVDLYAYTQPSTVYQLVGSGAVGSRGSVSFSLTLQGNTRLYAQVRGCPADPVADSQVVVVRSAVTLEAQRVGRLSYTFSGVVLPARPGGQSVSVYQVDVDGRVRIVGTAQTDATGRWSLTSTFPRAGLAGFVARTVGDAQNAAGTSRIRPTLVY